MKNWVFYVIGAIVFLVIYGYDKVLLLAISGGFGLGYLLHNYLDTIFKDWKTGIYDSEKKYREKRKKEIEAELERLNKGD